MIGSARRAVQWTIFVGKPMKSPQLTNLPTVTLTFKGDIGGS